VTVFLKNYYQMVSKKLFPATDFRQLTSHGSLQFKVRHKEGASHKCAGDQFDDTAGISHCGSRRRFVKIVSGNSTDPH
jgi:hypothetical protein